MIIPTSTTAFWLALIAAIFSGLNTLLITYLTRSQSSANESLLAASASAGVVHLPTAEALAASEAASAGGTIPFLGLDALPVWGQLAAPLPDGSMDPEQYNDCGETCVSMVVASVHGVPVPPGAVRAALGGVARSGLTTAADLVAALAYYNISAHAETPTQATIRSRVTALVSAAQPSIILGTWPTPGPLHWLLVTGADLHVMRYRNPWSAVASWISWTGVAEDYAGQLVVVDAHLHYDMRRIPTPI